ncbi:MAG: hypothetical protein ACTTJZ_00835 [Sphaerochaetaceae bacterium]
MTGLEFLGIVSSYGAVPLLVVLLVIIIIAMKDHSKKHDEMEASIGDLKASLEKRMAEQSAQADKAIGNLDKRILYMEQNYAEKSYVQETVSGWRMEIKDLGNRIDNYNRRIDRIMEVRGNDCKNN